eukprot:14125601-Heterocapsa_arctica.AAC.1
MPGPLPGTPGDAISLGASGAPASGSGHSWQVGHGSPLQIGNAAGHASGPAGPPQIFSPGAALMPTTAPDVAMGGTLAAFPDQMGAFPRLPPGAGAGIDDSRPDLVGEPWLSVPVPEDFVYTAVGDIEPCADGGSCLFIAFAQA